MANPDLKRDFLPVPLEFIGGPHTDIFALKNNKTVRETLEHRRYMKLAPEVNERYPGMLNQPLGEALLVLKKDGDSFYRRFLNRYGDETYSVFHLKDTRYAAATGIYAYFEANELRYIGRCKDSMKKRINQGYGKIHPKNCYLDGQTTNCHLNWKITTAAGKISLRLWPLSSTAEIERTEQKLIRTYQPQWNIQRA